MDGSTEIRLKPPTFGQGTIRLKQVLELHERDTGPGVLGGNLGDGYLCRTNPVFRAVREKVLQAGYSFSRRDEIHYFAFPLMCLDEVIAARVIPYQDNAHWLRELEARAPGRFSFEDLLRCSLQFNYLFHESVHCLAHQAFFGEARPRELPCDPPTLLRITLGEALANAAECLCSVGVAGEVGQYFIRANSHFSLDLGGVSTFLAVAREHGFAAAARVLVYSFLYANFLYRRVDRVELEKIARVSGCGAPGPGLEALARIAFALSEAFRMETSRLYLLKLGYRDADFALFDRDPLDLLDSEAMRAVDGVVALLIREMEPEFSWQ